MVLTRMGHDGWDGEREMTYGYGLTLIQANMETASVFCANDLCASLCCVLSFFECDVIYESGWPSQLYDVCLQEPR